MQATRLSSGYPAVVSDHPRLSYKTAVSPPELAAMSFPGGNGAMIFVTSSAQALRRLPPDA
jgi:hypothetical protein